MKTFPALLVLIAGLVLVQGDDAPAPTFSMLAGRFQLVSATVMILDSAHFNTQYRQEPKLFRIDTGTGETWVYSCTAWPLTVGTNMILVPIQSWEPISEDYFETGSNITAKWNPQQPSKPAFSPKPLSKAEQDIRNFINGSTTK